MSDEDYVPLRSGDAIAATAWMGETGGLEGDEVTIHAELTDVDEVAVVVKWFDVYERDMLVHLPRAQAIALAGQLASAATMSPAALPHGHGPDGPVAT